MSELAVIPVASHGGAPTRLTPRAFIRICRLIRIGWSVPDACRSESVTYRRFRQLCQSRPTYQRHFEKADQVRFNFRREHCERLVLEHSEKNWLAAMTWLERRVPELWSLKNVDRPEPMPVIGSTALQIRILTLANEDFDELQKEPGYTALADGGLQMVDGNLKITVYRQEHNERLLK
jgi:hypothetical protein